jgi:hydrogenase nickel incorporation protein HypA/HybF
VNSSPEFVKVLIMHEMAVAENIIKVIVDKLKESKENGQVKRIDLKIGKLTCVEPEALRLSFQAVSQGTPMEKASLNINSVSVTGKCKDCKKSFRLEKLEFACPFCGSYRIEIETGNELFIESFEIE